MYGLLPRSLLSPIPYNPDRSSGSLRSSFCGVLRRLSSGRLRCSSKKILGQIWLLWWVVHWRLHPFGSRCLWFHLYRDEQQCIFCWVLVPPPVLPWVPPPPRLPPNWSWQLSPLPLGRCCLHYEYQHGPVLYCRPACPSPRGSPSSWLVTGAGPSNPTHSRGGGR